MSIFYRRPNEPRPSPTVLAVVLEMSDGSKHSFPVVRPKTLRWGRDAGQVKVDLILSDQKAHLEQG